MAAGGADTPAAARLRQQQTRLLHIEADRGHCAEHLADVQLVEDRGLARRVQACGCVRGGGARSSPPPLGAALLTALLGAPGGPPARCAASVPRSGTAREGPQAPEPPQRSPSITTLISRLPNRESNIFRKLCPMAEPPGGPGPRGERAAGGAVAVGWRKERQGAMPGLSCRSRRANERAIRARELSSGNENATQAGSRMQWRPPCTHARCQPHCSKHDGVPGSGAAARAGPRRGCGPPALPAQRGRACSHCTAR